MANFEFGNVLNWEADAFSASPNQSGGVQDPSSVPTILFVGDLSYFCTEDDLLSLFSPFGQVVNVRIRRGVSGDSLMHGFVAYNNLTAARNALTELNGMEFMGRNMKVEMSADGQRRERKENNTWVQVHVSYVHKDTSMIVGEKILRTIFTQFGPVADVTVKKHSLGQRQQSGYGFVYYYDTNSALQATNSLLPPNNIINGIVFECSLSRRGQQMVSQQLGGLNPGNPMPPQLRQNPQYYNNNVFQQRPQLDNRMNIPAPSMQQKTWSPFVDFTSQPSVGMTTSPFGAPLPQQNTLSFPNGPFPTNHQHHMYSQSSSSTQQSSLLQPFDTYSISPHGNTFHQPQQQSPWTFK